MSLKTASSIGRLLYVLPLVGGALLLSQPGRAYADDDDSWVAEADADPPEDATVEGGYADTDPSAVTAYQGALSPYGTWVVDGTYGTVWVPNATVVGADFAPYQTDGHWALTDEGDWLWVSDYSWGYIPFHYGRWLWISDRGWSWIPGRAYAPSWVVWRTGAEGYIGWAPMPPAYYWSDGDYVAIDTPPPAPYVFCNTSAVFDPNVHGQVIRDRASVTKAVGGTSPYHGSRSGYGPSSPPLTVAHYTGPAPRPQTANPNAISLSRPAKPRPMSRTSSVGPSPNVKVLRNERSPNGTVNIRSVEHPSSPSVSRPAFRRSQEPASPQRVERPAAARPQPEPMPSFHVSTPHPSISRESPSFHSVPSMHSSPSFHPSAPAPRAAPAPSAPAPSHHSSSSGSHSSPPSRSRR